MEKNDGILGLNLNFLNLGSFYQPILESIVSLCQIMGVDLKVKVLLWIFRQHNAAQFNMTELKVEEFKMALIQKISKWEHDSVTL